MDDLFLHSTTRSQLQSLVQDFPQGLLISGPHGVGTATIAAAVAQQVIDDPASISLLVPDEKGTITIAAVRELYVQTRTKSTQRRIVIIDNAESMGSDAQNAFLKLLEEPSSTVAFILTSHSPSSLLPTIHSRVQHVDVLPVDHATSRTILQQHADIDAQVQAQLLFIGQGLPAELTRLGRNVEYRDARIILAQSAKQLLSGARYQQIVAAGTLSAKNRVEVLAVLQLVTAMLRAQLVRAQSDEVLQKITVFMNAQLRIEQNGHIRTQLLNAVMA